MQATEALNEFIDTLRARVLGDIRTDTMSKVLYSTDASIYQAMPTGVLIPKSVDDILAAVELAAKHRVPILPRAGGTSLAGQTVNEAFVVDVSAHLDKVIEVNTEESFARVQPGLAVDVFNDVLRPHGVQFGPDPASSNRATMGGTVANNATGSHSILYGMCVDHVIGCEAVLSDGSRAAFGPLESEMLQQKKKASGLEGDIYRGIEELIANAENRRTIAQSTPRHWRRSGGYNLDRLCQAELSFHHVPDPRFNVATLLCGSEGTLAMMTELTVKLVPLPKKKGLAILHFDNLREALTSVPVILETKPSAIELLDNASMTLCRKQPAFRRMLESFVEGNPFSLLLVEYYGETEAELESKVSELEKHLKVMTIRTTAFKRALSDQLQSNVWSVRKGGLNILMSQRGDFKPIPFIEDAAVPVENLPEYIEQIESYCKELDTPISYYAHASAGCLHVRPFINLKEKSELDKMNSIARRSLELAKGYGGVISSEHGAGRTRSWLNRELFGEALYTLHRQVKQAFDPHNLFNPGNLVNAPSMTEKLRYGPRYQTVQINEKLDHRADDGFSGGVEMCNGAGICRKLGGGTMCPSFMVTRDEEHSTRGRANALRAALSGIVPISELTSKRMYEVMDLCIECKACKSECPSSVDMAKLKFEFLAQYREKHGISLRDRLFANIPFLSRYACGPFAPLSNALNRNSLFKKLFGKALGIAAKRDFPEFAKVPFTAWFKNRTSAPSALKVVLFHDTFNTYNYPHVSIAATEVLEALGCEVTLPGHRCCGRPFISKGLVREARKAARDTVDVLKSFAEHGIPIVGLEPSCILTLRDEYLYLLPDDPAAKLVAENSYLFEEFYAAFKEKFAKLPHSKNGDRRVLVHGHCHQKALAGMAPLRSMLDDVKGLKIQEVDSGCCGMAGAFGYEAEHYDISLKMGERRLLPAVRNEPDNSTIVAPGVSCRQQIKHGTGKVALHPVELLRQLLD